MIGLLQRVTEARVEVKGQTIAQIATGLLVFIGIEKNDSEKHADLLVDRLLNYRVFPDADGKMNLSLKDINGSLLLVSQFTLAAETDRGQRPSFSSAANPETSKLLYNYLVQQARANHRLVESGIFAADMMISLCNDGPVTFWLQVCPDRD